MLAAVHSQYKGINHIEIKIYNDLIGFYTVEKIVNEKNKNFLHNQTNKPFKRNGCIMRVLEIETGHSSGGWLTIRLTGDIAIIKK